MLRNCSECSYIYKIFLENRIKIKTKIINIYKNIIYLLSYKQIIEICVRQNETEWSVILSLYCYTALYSRFILSNINLNYLESIF